MEKKKILSFCMSLGGMFLRGIRRIILPFIEVLFPFQWSYSAAEYNQLEAVKLLKDLGCNVNEENREKQTALHLGNNYTLIQNDLSYQLTPWIL